MLLENPQGKGQADIYKQTEEEAAKMLGQMKILLVGNQGSLHQLVRLDY